MPQMAPLSWGGLYFMSLIGFGLVNSLNYWITDVASLTSTSGNASPARTTSSVNSFNWTW